MGLFTAWLGQETLIGSGYPPGILLGNALFAGISLFALLWNGIFRMYFTSMRLRVRMRLFMLLAMWIPLVNVAVLLYAMRLVAAEYDFACYKENVRNSGPSQICARPDIPLCWCTALDFGI